MNAFKSYTIYRRPHGTQHWIETAHSVKARTSNEANAKMRKMFQGAGFHGMGLVASAFDPNLLGMTSHER